MSSLHEASQFMLARWILPVAGPPVERGCLALDGDRILGVVSGCEYDGLPPQVKAGRTTDFGEAVIVPGLVNLHTHLDYSALKHLDNYSTFMEWIPKLVRSTFQWDKQRWFESALAGGNEVLRSGTSFVADSSYSGAAARAVAHLGLRGIVALELFGFSETDVDRVFAEWLQRYERLKNEAEPVVKEALASRRLQITIAPHTPFTVCPALISRSLDWARAHGLPLFIHVSESVAECNWIAAHDKDIDRFLQSFGKSLETATWRGHGLSPVQHLASHNLLGKDVLAAHLVHINEADIEILASCEVAAVHCPRSNSRLRNGVAPLSKLINAGIRLGLGTDSAASCDDLNILNETRFAWNLHRAVDRNFNETAEKALYYLTLGAAQALNLQASLGSLEAGKKSDIAVFSLSNLPEMARQKPHECLIYGGAELSCLLVDGKFLVHNGSVRKDTPAASLS